MAALRGLVAILLVGFLLAGVLAATPAAAHAYDYDAGTRPWIGERDSAAAPVGEQPVGAVTAGRLPVGHRYDDFANLARGSARLDEYRPAPQTQRALPAGTSVNQWSGSTVSRVTRTDEVFYRVHGGQSGQVGEWLTPIRPTSGASARAGLALPPGNTAESVSRVVVPAGTRIQVGTAGQAFGIEVCLSECNDGREIHAASVGGQGVGLSRRFRW